MIATSSKPQLVCFDLFELDLASRQLHRQGRAVPLQDQPLQLLILLVQHPGDLIGREEIRQKLWPRDTFVEFDDSVNHAVRKVREALGDSATKPRFLETVPRQGYRFIAPVQTAPTSALPPKDKHVAGMIHSPWLGWVMIVIAALISCAAVFIHTNTQARNVHSLAVLPLENLSGDPSQEYFSDGVTESIITDLGQISGLRVISRTSVMQFKHTNKSLPQIARELDVDALIEGGVVRSGSRVRITAQLVAANPERHMWAASYERNAGDMIGLQREVAEAVAREMRLRLGGTSAPPHAISAQAYELYLRGREHLNQFSVPGFMQAAEYLEQVIRVEPNYAPAHASLAMAYTQLGYLGGLPRDQAADKAKHALTRALALDDGLAETHAASAYARFLFEWDWSAPDAEFHRSLELNPNSADARHLYSIYLTLCGRFDDAIRENQLAIKLDPLNAFVNANLGWIYAMARRNAEGIAFMRQLQQRNPDYLFVHHHLAQLYAQQGNCTAALVETEQDSGIDAAFVFAQCGRRDKAQSILADAEREVANGKLDAIYPALISAPLGDRDAAFRWLDRAIDTRSALVVLIKVTPELDSLRSDPRFAIALRRCGAD